MFQLQPDVHLLLLCAEGSVSDPSHNCPLLSCCYGATGHASPSSESAAVLRPPEQFGSAPFLRCTQPPSSCAFPFYPGCLWRRRRGGGDDERGFVRVHVSRRHFPAAAGRDPRGGPLRCGGGFLVPQLPHRPSEPPAARSGWFWSGPRRDRTPPTHQVCGRLKCSVYWSLVVSAASQVTCLPSLCCSLSFEDTSSVHTGAGCSLPSRTFCPAQSVAGRNEPLPHNQSCSRPQAARTDSAGGDVVDDSLCPHADGRVPEKSGDTGSRQRSSSSWGGLLTPQMAPATNPGCCTDAEETEESRFPGTAPGFGSFPNSPDHDGPPWGTCLPASSACSTHERLTSSVTQQRLHEPGLAPSGPVAPQPTSLAQALPQQPNRHGAHPPPPPGLLTPEQEANICQPVIICEEIRLTPQIRGPPLPAPPTPPQVYSETLPQGQGSGSAPRCFTQPLSGASVMEGSPVTLEVEVSGEPEPRVAGWVASNHLHDSTEA